MWERGCYSTTILAQHRRPRRLRHPYAVPRTSLQSVCTRRRNCIEQSSPSSKYTPQPTHFPASHPATVEGVAADRSFVPRCGHSSRRAGGLGAAFVGGVDSRVLRKAGHGTQASRLRSHVPNAKPAGVESGRSVQVISRYHPLPCSTKRITLNLRDRTTLRCFELTLGYRLTECFDAKTI
jgi:hypothetical protein